MLGCWIHPCWDLFCESTRNPILDVLGKDLKFYGKDFVSAGRLEGARGDRDLYSAGAFARFGRL